MTTEDVREILIAIGMLDRFAEKTSAPIDRQWHANWQMVYQQVVTRIQTIAAKQSSDSDAPPSLPA